ncbi:MAG: ABC transporter permease [Acidimicrobiales bacterium]|nr:ABC transporter permease [Acidimicrobiales bacterium]
MIKLIAGRIVLLIGLLLAVTMLTFGAMNLLGDPLFNILGPVAQSTDPRDQPDIEAARADFNLDRSLPVRYGLWLEDVVVNRDFGRSYGSKLEVNDIMKDRLPKSLLLAGMALLMGVVIAIPWGVWAASRANKPVDKLSTVATFGIVALPNFALGVLLYYAFALKLQWFPLKFIDNEGLYMRLKSMFLPALTLALPLAAVYQRLLRTDLITTLQEDFILMARSKGVPKWKVLFGHALRPSMFSFITVFGLNAGALIGGALVVETIFNIPGAGSQIVESIIRDDFPVVLAIIVVITAGFVVLNLLVDVLYSILDPRVRS